MSWWVVLILAPFIYGCGMAHGYHRRWLPRCPEIKLVRPVGARYEVTLRCEYDAGHDGPCKITEGLNWPIYWNPKKELEE